MVLAGDTRLARVARVSQDAREESDPKKKVITGL
jgi:hypothetical protein